MITATIEQARKYAFEAHDGQMRDFSGEPYINHPYRVAGILYEAGYSTDTVIAAVLHDVLEDTPITPKQMIAEFGQEITKLVLHVTEPEKLREKRTLKKPQRKAEFNRQLSAAPVKAQAIKLADIIDNTRDMAKFVHVNTIRAENFLYAKRSMLLLLTKGNTYLYKTAQKELDNLEQALLNWFKSNAEEE